MKSPNTIEEFAELVDNGKHVFYFTANWCGDCQFIKPALPEIEAAFPEYEFVEINRDRFIDICQKWGIMGIPSFVVIENGKEIGRLVNKDRKTKEQIIKFLNRVQEKQQETTQTSETDTKEEVVVESQEYQNILVGVDGSDQAREAFEKAVEVAKRNNARIILACVIENQTYNVVGYTTMNAELMQNETDEVEDMLKEYKEYARAAGFTNVETVVSFGSPKAVMIDELAPKYQVDLIMVGQSGLNAVERFMMGSVSSYIIRHAPCDVLVVRPNKETEKEK